MELTDILDQRHELVKLADIIDGKRSPIGLETCTRIAAASWYTDPAAGRSAVVEGHVQAFRR
jgi:hypothetical protein